MNAYLDNMIDVATLLEDSDTKTAALEKVADLEEALSHVSVTELMPYSRFYQIFPLQMHITYFLFMTNTILKATSRNDQRSERILCHEGNFCIGQGLLYILFKIRS